jgi:hypothetical protein
MKRDPFDAAIDDILATAGGDARRALRAVLEENVQLNSSFEICMPHQSMASARTPRNPCISAGSSSASVA